MERALVFAEIYSFAGLFVSMSNIWKIFLSAVFKFLDISLLRHYSDIASKGNVTFIEDICANVKGYEYLAMQKQRRQAV